MQNTVTKLIWENVRQILTVAHDQDWQQKCRCRHKGWRQWHRTERSVRICWQTWLQWTHRQTWGSTEWFRRLDNCCTHSSECWSDQTTTSLVQCIAAQQSRKQHTHELVSNKQVTKQNHLLLPPLSTASQHYQLHQTAHSSDIPERTGHLTDSNFLTHLIHRHVLINTLYC